MRYLEQLFHLEINSFSRRRPAWVLSADRAQQLKYSMKVNGNSQQVQRLQALMRQAFVA